MNLTISHLFLINIYKSSPTFMSTNTHLSSVSYFQIEKSSFKHFFSSFYHTSFIQLRKQFIVTSTLFERFLSSALCFDHRYLYSNEILDSRRLSFIIGPVNISYCKFRLCLGSTKNSFGSDTFHNKGGAIFCLTNLSLYQCLFEHNSAARGGSIYCSGELTLKSVTFDGGFSDECQGFVNENCASMPLLVDLCLFFDLESTNYACFSRLSPGSISIIGNNLSTNSANQKNAGFYLSEATSLTMRFCILFELISLSETSVWMDKCGKSEIDRNLFWYIKSNSNSKSGSNCLSFYDTKSICTVKECSFLICSPGNIKLFAASGGAQIFITGGCSTGSEDDLFEKKTKKDKEKSDLDNPDSNKKLNYDVIFDKKSRFNDKCEDRYVIYVSNPFGYYTKNEEIELATKQADIYDGFIIGALAITIVIISSVVSFTLFYQCTVSFS